MKPGLLISPSSITSTPSCTCRRTMSPTASRSRTAYAAVSTGPARRSRGDHLEQVGGPRKAARMGRRILSVLRFIGSPPWRVSPRRRGAEWQHSCRGRPCLQRGREMGCSPTMQGAARRTPPTSPALGGEGESGGKDSAGLGARHWSAASPVTEHGIRLAVEENTQMAVSGCGPFRSPVAAGGSSQPDKFSGRRERGGRPDGADRGAC